MSEPTIDILKTRIDGLNFQSEGDCLWSIFAPTVRRYSILDVSLMERLTGRKRANHPDYSTFDSFFDHVTNPAVQPQAKRYAELRESMIEMLGTRRVFWMTGSGNFNLQIYVVGIDYLNNLVGITVGATET